jgi:hypothetical protein
LTVSGKYFALFVEEIGFAEAEVKFSLDRRKEWIIAVRKATRRKLTSANFPRIPVPTAPGPQEENWSIT